MSAGGCVELVESNVEQVKKWAVKAFLMGQNNRGGRSRASQPQRLETGVRDCGRTRPGTRLWE